MKHFPNFLVIGAPKSGTTSLFYYIKQHPEIYLPVQKELHYFSFDKLVMNSNGPKDSQVLDGLCRTKDEYIKHYRNVKNEKAIGDISPSYLYYETHDKIKHELGLVKIVVILRNPVEKAYSQYMHMVRDQREGLSFYDALLAEDERKKNGWSDIWRYAESSLYSDRLNAFIDSFGRENVHVIIFDDFIKNPNNEVRKLFLFLGVNQNITVNTQSAYNRTGEARSIVIAEILGNKSRLKNIVKSLIPSSLRIKMRLKIMDINTKEKRGMDKASKNYLMKYFKEDMLNLENILDRKLPWKNG